MYRVIVGIVGVTAIVVVSVLVMRLTAPTAQVDGSGAIDTTEIIEARRVLMRQVQRSMQPIDAFTVEGAGDAATVRSAAETIEAMMLAFPHLFPPATNLYDATLREPPTIALPAVWQGFATFRGAAEKSERAAAAVAASTEATSLRTAAVALRSSCEDCHARFTQAYVPPRVTQEDLDFDFDSVFGKN
jgi:cytochrome c556